MIIFNFKFRDMKKQVLMMAALALALGGCSKTETTDVAQGRAIGFDTFVGKSTKAVTEVTDNTLKEFYVFGDYEKSPSWVDVFENVKVIGTTVGESSEWTPEQTAYWQTGKTYKFGAYADGNSGKLESASFDPASEKLTFTNYAVGDNDLIAAIPASVEVGQPVSLTFSHLLSQVKFTFTNEDADTYTMKISNIKIESAVTTCTGTYDRTDGAKWEGASTTGTYNFKELEDIAGTSGETDLLVIPQSNENLVVSFTAIFKDASGTELTRGNFTAPLAYSGDAAGTKVNEWTPGFKYNYVATINGSTIDEDLEQQVIKFTVESVTPWDDATDTTIDEDDLQKQS